MSQVFYKKNKLIANLYCSEEKKKSESKHLDYFTSNMNNINKSKHWNITFNNINEQELKVLIPEDNPGFRYCICKLTDEGSHKSCKGYIQFNQMILASFIKKLILERVPQVAEMMKHNKTTNKNNNNKNENTENNNKTLERRNTKKYWNDNCNVTITSIDTKILTSTLLDHDQETEQIFEFGNLQIKQMPVKNNIQYIDYLSLQDKIRNYNSWKDVLNDDQFKKMNYQILFELFKQTRIQLQNVSLLTIEWHKKTLKLLELQPKKNTVIWINPTNIINDESEILQFLNYCKKIDYGIMEFCNNYIETLKKYKNQRVIYYNLFNRGFASADKTTVMHDSDYFQLQKLSCSHEHYIVDPKNQSSEIDDSIEEDNFTIISEDNRSKSKQILIFSHILVFSNVEPDYKKLGSSCSCIVVQ